MLWLWQHVSLLPVADSFMAESIREGNVASRAAIHWDDADLPREVVMRPVVSLGNDWHWSGSFKLSTR